MADRKPKLAIGIPTYHQVPTPFFSGFLNLERKGIDVVGCIITSGVYLSAAMRGIREEIRELDWERLLIIEADMILPPDALLKHAHHTEPIVGSAYFMHTSPFQPIFTAPMDEIGWHRTFSYDETKAMMEKPGLYEAMNVGFGCTSIRRDVLDDWPSDLVMFSNRQGVTAEGKSVEMGHDVAFCLEARRFGWKSYVDTSIRCGHMSSMCVTSETCLDGPGMTLGRIDHIRSLESYDVQEPRTGSPQTVATDLAMVPSAELIAKHK